MLLTARGNSRSVGRSHLRHWSSPAFASTWADKRWIVGWVGWVGQVVVVVAHAAAKGVFDLPSQTQDVATQAPLAPCRGVRSAFHCTTQLSAWSLSLSLFWFFVIDISAVSCHLRLGRGRAKHAKAVRLHALVVGRAASYDTARLDLERVLHGGAVELRRREHDQRALLDRGHRRERQRRLLTRDQDLVLDVQRQTVTKQKTATTRVRLPGSALDRQIETRRTSWPAR